MYIKPQRRTSPLSVDFIKQVNSLVLTGKIDNSDVSDEKKLTKIINDYLESSKHLIIRASRFLSEFTKLRPFADGNGRTIRLLVNFELMKDGFPPITFEVGDKHIYRRGICSPIIMEDLIIAYLTKILRAGSDYCDFLENNDFTLTFADE